MKCLPIVLGNRAACLAVLWLVVLLASRAGGEALDWARLPAIPDDEGFAAPFTGVCGGALVVAGGANFPDGKPWEGGTKVWYDQVFMLPSPRGTWHKAGRLPRSLAYGVSITTPEGIACLGGADAERHWANCFWLKLQAGRVQIAPLPSLPQPCAYACGALLDGRLYVAGGSARPDATEALGTFWSLDLNDLSAGWQSLSSWPGDGRMLATAGAYDGAFFLFAGTALEAGPEGLPERRMLRDAYRYHPERGWTRLADLPRAAVAAPSPAPLVAPGACWSWAATTERNCRSHLPSTGDFRAMS